MLRFYGLYKQSTEGKCNQPKPSFWAVINKAKWDAWKCLGNMPKEEAMKKYVEELKQVYWRKPAVHLKPLLMSSDFGRLSKPCPTLRM